MEVCGARGILIIPKWLSVAFWATFFPMGDLRPSVRGNGLLLPLILLSLPEPFFGMSLNAKRACLKQEMAK